MLATTNPNLSLQLPPGWRSTPVAEYRKLFVAFIAEWNDPEVKRGLERALADIDSGALRATGQGPTGPSCYTGDMRLTIRPTATTVDTAVAAWRAHTREWGLSDTLESTEPVVLPIGPAARLIITLDPPGGILSRTTEYVVLLPDHRVAILSGVSPAGDTDFPALVDAAARSMTSD